MTETGKDNLMFVLFLRRTFDSIIGKLLFPFADKMQDKDRKDG